MDTAKKADILDVLLRIRAGIHGHVGIQTMARRCDD